MAFPEDLLELGRGDWLADKLGHASVKSILFKNLFGECGKTNDDGLWRGASGRVVGFNLVQLADSSSRLRSINVGHAIVKED